MYQGNARKLHVLAELSKRVGDWRSIAGEYVRAKHAGTSATVPIGRVAGAIAVMTIGEKMAGAAVAREFGESTSWMQSLQRWALLHPEAQKLFAFGRSRDHLGLGEDTVMLKSAPLQDQPRRAELLLQNRKAVASGIRQRVIVE